MGSYVNSALTKDEKVEYEGQVSKWSLLPTILFGIVLLPFFGIGILFLASAAITYYTTELAITNKRVIAKFGLISRQTFELKLDKIEAVHVTQGILGRIFNYGHVGVAGAGNGAPIPGISNPLVFRRSFLDIQEASAKI